MKVLAIGATGFLGPHVVRELAACDHDVAVVHRGETEAALPGGVRRIVCDRAALGDVRAELAAFAPDVVLDVIAYTEAQARDSLDIVRGLADRYVVVSSCDVYRNYDGLRGKLAAEATPDPTPLPETAPLRDEHFPYRGHDIPFAHREDYDKILVERAVLDDPGVAGTVLRLPAVYGPGDRQHRLRPHLMRMDDARPAILFDEAQAEWRWTRGYVENVAAAIALAVADARAAGRVYNVGEPEAFSLREWVERIGRAAEWSGSVRALPAARLPEHLRKENDWRFHLATDTNRLRTELGYREPAAPDRALAATIAWERLHLADAERPDYAAEDAALA